jgi:hypothetical protein
MPILRHENKDKPSILLQPIKYQHRDEGRRGIKRNKVRCKNKEAYKEIIFIGFLTIN